MSDSSTTLRGQGLPRLEGPTYSVEIPCLISVRRVVLLSALSGGLYLYYWFFITWKHYRDHTGAEAYPAWHALSTIGACLRLVPCLCSRASLQGPSHWPTYLHDNHSLARCYHGSCCRSARGLRVRSPRERTAYSGCGTLACRVSHRSDRLHLLAARLYPGWLQFVLGSSCRRATSPVDTGRHRRNSCHHRGVLGSAGCCCDHCGVGSPGRRAARRAARRTARWTLGASA